MKNTALFFVFFLLFLGCKKDIPVKVKRPLSQNALKHKQDVKRDSFIDKLLGYEPANVEERIVTEESSQKIPQSFIFVWETPAGYSYLTSDLSQFCLKNNDFDGTYSCNVTLLEWGKKYMLVPRHTFTQENGVSEILLSQGFRISAWPADLLVQDSVNFNQTALTAIPAESYPINTDSAIGEISTLRYLKEGIVHYQIRGDVHYLNSSEMSQFFPTIYPFPRGGYIVRVPRALYNKIPGMSGGSLVVNNRLIGIMTERVSLDSSAVFMLAHPLLQADIKIF